MRWEYRRFTHRLLVANRALSIALNSIITSHLGRVTPYIIMASCFIDRKEHFTSDMTVIGDKRYRFMRVTIDHIEKRAGENSSVRFISQKENEEEREKREEMGTCAIE